MKEINLEIHKDFLNSGKAEVIALRDSYIPGYFSKGEKLQVVYVVGSMLRIKTDENFTCLVYVGKVALPDNHIESVHCSECMSLYKDKHAHGCKTILGTEV